MTNNITAGKTEVINIVHFIPGRIRLQDDSIRENTEKAELISNEASGIDYIRDMKINTVTGSMLFCFDENISCDEIINRLKKDISCFSNIRNFEASDLCMTNGSGKVSISGLPLYTKAVISFFSTMNNSVLKFTGNRMDIKFLLPAGFTCMGIHKGFTARHEGTPFWINLFVFALSTFLGLNFNGHKGSKNNNK